MELAVQQAREQGSCYGSGENAIRPNPLVGCVVVTPKGNVYTSYRGKKCDGDEGRNCANDHAEYTALEKLVPQGEHVGATVFTTLEPCTRREGNAVSCADRLVDAKVKRVVIGYLDPDDRGHGISKLADANIELAFFEPDLMNEIRKLNQHFLDSRLASSLCRPWFSEIERACGNKIKILGDLATAPKMKRVGKYAFPPELNEPYEKNVRRNEEQWGGWIEQIAEFKSLTQGGSVIEYEDYDYLQWKTLREAGRKPRAIYAGAIVVCADTGSIYVHRRAPDVATEPNKLHSFAGGFIVAHQNISDETLLHACLRELQEESGVQPQFAETRVVIVENLDIGWIDVMFFGGTIPDSHVQRLKGSREGQVVPIPFDEIEKSICHNKDNWVISGIAHHLIWLKLGAPGAPSWFRQKNAPMLYKNICQWLTPSESSRPS
ncbi:MAG: NUDIX domain-containing protein [Akkermansiaceae bacterium]|nr:NUDIX domain-containing protein [Verrucomicrobiales bacterium]